jgi:transcriptional regulator with XRE-family HTH domain
MITITAADPIGPLLRRLRVDAGLTVRDVARRTHLSRSGVAKRESSTAGYLGALVETVNALGYDVAIVPREPA